MTLREHLEAIEGIRWWATPDAQLMFEHAQAALALLNASNAVSQEKIPVGVPTPGRYRLVLDPKPTTRQETV